MTPSPYMNASADISPDAVYRYSLFRRLSIGNRAVLFVGLNPSTADAATDDPTIRRCVGFARSWGFDWLLMGNVYAFRSTDPTGLMLVEDPVGPENERALNRLIRRAELVVAAWGGNRLQAHAGRLAAWILALEHTRCLGENRDGSPTHPLYLRRDTALRKPGAPGRVIGVKARHLLEPRPVNRAAQGDWQTTSRSGQGPRIGRVQGNGR